MWRPSPLWQRGGVATEGSVVELVNEDAKEGGGVFIGVGLELGLDLDDECGCYSGEKTSLFLRLARVQ